MIVRSPWDGHDRAPLRIALALAAAFDACVVAYLVSTRPPSSGSHPLAPGWLLALGGHPVPALALAALAIGLAFRFASRPDARGAGLALLAVSALLNEALGALYEGPMRVFFTSGATLAGWMAGLFYASRLGAREPRRAEALAEIGAAAGLAATYVGALLSKLSQQGVSWVDASNLQSVIVSQQRLDRPHFLLAYSDFVASSTPVAAAMAAITLLAQASMILHPWSPRTRAWSAILVIAFHVNVALLTPIYFISPVVLLAVFSFPWPRLWARFRGHPSDPAPPDAPSFDLAPDRARRAALEALALAALLALVAWGSPLRRYTHLHHDGRHAAQGGEGSPTPPPADVTALLGGLAIGDPLASLQVARIDVRDRRLTVALRGAGSAAMRVVITRTGALGYHAPRTTRSYDLFYESVRGVDDATRDRVLDAVEQRITRAERAVAIPAGL
jgi:hypothetical protein